MHSNPEKAPYQSIWSPCGGFRMLNDPFSTVVGTFFVQYGKAVVVVETVDGRWPSIITVRLLKKVMSDGVEKKEDAHMPKKATMQVNGNMLTVSMDLLTVTSRNRGGSQLCFELVIGDVVLTSVDATLMAKDHVWTNRFKRKAGGPEKKSGKNRHVGQKEMKRLLAEVQWSPSFFGSSLKGPDRIFYYCQICLGRKKNGHVRGCRMSKML